MKEGYIYVPYLIIESTPEISGDFKPRKIIRRTVTSFLNGKWTSVTINYDLEDDMVINIEDVDRMEADEWGEGYWYFKYTGKLLNKDQIKELGL